VDYSKAVNWRTLRLAFLWIASVALAIIGVVVVWNRRLAAELAARRAAEQLLRARDGELRSAVQRLEISNEEKDMLVHMVAHDLKNPLTAISFGCEMLRTEAVTAEHPASQRLESIRTSANKMMTLISRLLRLHTIEDTAFRLVPKDFALARVAADVIDRLQGLAASKGIRVLLHEEARDLRVRADREAVDQVLDNLISNAIKFSPRGKEVHVRFGVADSGIGRIEVADQGPGIDPEDLPKLFVKFARLSARPTAGEPSHGLGLSIAKRLITLMNGRIFCKNNGVGATFVVELPTP